MSPWHRSPMAAKVPPKSWRPRVRACGKRWLPPMPMACQGRCGTSAAARRSLASSRSSRWLKSSAFRTPCWRRGNARPGASAMSSARSLSAVSIPSRSGWADLPPMTQVPACWRKPAFALPMRRATHCGQPWIRWTRSAPQRISSLRSLAGSGCWACPTSTIRSAGQTARPLSSARRRACKTWPLRMPGWSGLQGDARQSSGWMLPMRMAAAPPAASALRCACSAPRSFPARPLCWVLPASMQGSAPSTGSLPARDGPMRRP
ncbi:hypothetical protein D3C72_1421450 [compost metagenome]